MGARRPAEVGALVDAALSVRRRGDRGAHRRGRRRRRAHPADARRRRQRPVEGTSRRAGTHDPARADRNRRQLLSGAARGLARRLGRVHAAGEEEQGGTRPQPQFPRQLAAGVRAAGRRSVSDLRAGSARGRRLHRPASERLRRHDLPHLERRAAAPLRAPARRGDARRGPVALPPDRRQGPGAHRLSGALGLSRLPLPPQAGDRWHFRLDLRAPRPLQLGGRDLEPDARGGHRELPLHRLVPRPPGRRRRQAVAMESRPAARSRPRPVAAVRAPAARPHRDRRLEPLPRVLEPAARAARTRTAALSALAALAGADLAAAGAGDRGGGSPERRPVQAAAGGAEHRLAAELRVQARAGAQGRARRDRRDRAAVRRHTGAGQAARGSRSARREGLQAHRRFVLARCARHRRPGQGRMGGARRRRRRGRADAAARQGGRGSRPRAAALEPTMPMAALCAGAGRARRYLVPPQGRPRAERGQSHDGRLRREPAPARWTAHGDGRLPERREARHGPVPNPREAPPMPAGPRPVTP